MPTVLSNNKVKVKAHLTELMWEAHYNQWGIQEGTTPKHSRLLDPYEKQRISPCGGLHLWITKSSPCLTSSSSHITPTSPIYSSIASDWVCLLLSDNMEEDAQAQIRSVGSSGSTDHKGQPRMSQWVNTSLLFCGETYSWGASKGPSKNEHPLGVVPITLISHLSIGFPWSFILTLESTRTKHLHVSQYLLICLQEDLGWVSSSKDPKRNIWKDQKIGRDKIVT